MTTKKKSSEKFTQKTDKDTDLLTSADKMSALSKSLSPLIPVGKGEGSEGANVHFLSNTDVRSEKMEQCRVDCDELSAMELRRTYKAEANSHRNMLRRENAGLAKVPRADWKGRGGFREFLRSEGAKLSPTLTLDREHPSDPEYAPGKVRWANKRTQPNNRGVSLLIEYEGKQYTTAEIAKRQGVKQTTIQKRHRRGWTDAEIFVVHRSPTPTVPTSPDGLSVLFTIPSLEPVWDRAMAAAYPGEWHHLSPKDKKRLNDYATQCAQGKLVYEAEHILEYVIKNWDRFCSRAERQESAFNLPEVLRTPSKLMRMSAVEAPNGKNE
jgi:hypothetical protein